MISKITGHLANQLNEFLVQKYNLDEHIVVITDGRDEVAIAKKISFTLINLSLDLPRADRRPAATALQENPQLVLSFFILVSANFSADDYPESLTYISDITSFFWAKPTFDEIISPTDDGELYTGFVEFEETSIKDMQTIFSAIGRTYMPSVLYRVRFSHA